MTGLGAQEPMVSQAESVAVADTTAQAAWKQLAESGAGDLARSYVLCTAIVGLARAGIAERLSAQWTPLSELVPPNGSSELTRQVLRYIEIRGLAESDGECWRLTARGVPLLDELSGALLGYYAQAYGPVFASMAGQLAGTQAYGVDVARDAEALGHHCEVLFRSFGTELISDLIRKHDARAVLDLGCGTGGLILDLCQLDPRLRGVGLDIAPEPIEFAARRAKEAGISGRASFLVADAFRPDEWPAEAATCDLFVAVGALHEHFRDGEAAVVSLLRGYGELLRRPGAKAFILAEPELYHDAADADFFLVHVLSAQGMPRQREDWLKVIAAAGLDCQRVYAVPGTGFRFAYYEVTAGRAA